MRCERQWASLFAADATSAPAASPTAALLRTLCGCEREYDGGHLSPIVEVPLYATRVRRFRRADEIRNGRRLYCEVVESTDAEALRVELGGTRRELERLRCARMNRVETPALSACAVCGARNECGAYYNLREAWLCLPCVRSGRRPAPRPRSAIARTVPWLLAMVPAAIAAVAWAVLR